MKGLTVFGELIGLLFQVVDDILDETASFEKLGKSVGKDKESGKSTFISLLGQEGARAYADELYETACKKLEWYGSRASLLTDLCSFIRNRDH